MQPAGQGILRIALVPPQDDVQADEIESPGQPSAVFKRMAYSRHHVKKHQQVQRRQQPERRESRQREYGTTSQLTAGKRAETHERDGRGNDVGSKDMAVDLVQPTDHPDQQSEKEQDQAGSGLIAAQTLGVFLQHHRGEYRAERYQGARQQGSEQCRAGIPLVDIA